MQDFVPERQAFGELERNIRECRLCEDRGWIPEVHPVLQIAPGARIGVFGQAPGNRAHQAGRPFADSSGVRLREWLDVSPEEFYDPLRVAIVPMGFCFPGYVAPRRTDRTADRARSRADRPPVPACAERWRSRLMEHLGASLQLVVLVGGYSQRWHLPESRGLSLTEVVRRWKDFENHPLRGSHGPCCLPHIPLPHPSWRNNAWLRRNPWFEETLLPELRRQVRNCLG